MRLLKRNRRLASVLGWMVVAGLLTAAALSQADKPDTRDAQTAQGIAVLLLIPLSILAKAALQAVIATLFPHWTSRARTAVEEHRGLCLGWGAVIGVFLFVLLLISAAVAGAGGQAIAALGVMILLVALLLANWGFVGAATAMGARLLPADGPDDERSSLQASAGALVLALACLIPVIGWVLALLLVFVALGAAVVTLFGSGRQTEARRARPPSGPPDQGPDDAPGEVF